MKRLELTKIIVSLLIVASALALSPIKASAEWKQDSNGWWNTERDSYSVGWKQIDGKWYYFDKNGYMKTGWILDGDKWYYLDSNGDMAKNTTINGYKIDSDGVWIQSSQNSSTKIDSQAKKISDDTEVINRDSIVRHGTNKTYKGNVDGVIIGIADGWVYYVGGFGFGSGGGIYKMKDNEKIKLSDEDYISDAILYKGSIYYSLGPKTTNNVTQFGFYKVDIDGKNKVQLSDQSVDGINI